MAALSRFLFQLAKLKSQKLLHPPERKGRKRRRNPGSGRRRLQSPRPKPLRRSLRPGSQRQPKRRRRRKPPAPPEPRRVREAGRQGPPGSGIGANVALSGRSNTIRYTGYLRSWRHPEMGLARATRAGPTPEASPARRGEELKARWWPLAGGGGRTRRLSFRISDPPLQMTWPRSLTPYSPWIFCGSACMRRLRRRGARWVGGEELGARVSVLQGFPHPGALPGRLPALLAVTGLTGGPWQLCSAGGQVPFSSSGGAVQAKPPC